MKIYLTDITKKEDLKMKELVEVVYKGIVHTITKQEFEDLQNGYISWSDMFD